jgi:hypothetical protein
MPRAPTSRSTFTEEGSMMKRAVGFLSIAGLVVCLAGAASADDRYGSSGEHGTPGATSGTAAGSSSAGFMGQHMMTGTVKDVDKDDGKVSIEAEGKNLELHFPQTALQNLNKGDRVTVQLAIRKATGGTGSTTSGAPSGAGAGTSGSRGETGGGMR